MVLMHYTSLFVDVKERRYWREEYPLREVCGPVELGVKLHLERFESWRKPIYHPDNVLVIGRGIFAGSKLYGAHRLIAVFRSPLTTGLHICALGGAAYQFNLNADSLVISGMSEKPTVLKIICNHEDYLKVEFYEIELKELVHIWRDYRGLKGVYALQEYLLDVFRDFYEKYNARSILVGPGSLHTNVGALVSLTIVKNKIDYGSEDFAARAGGGSVLLRAHNVAAIVYGGKHDRSSKLPRELVDISALNKISVEILGKPYIQAVIDAGVKYRYDPKINSGGTFGGNYPQLGITTPMLNWKTIYESKEVRKKLHDLIMKYMWEIFNKEAIETRSWKTCGEPCPLACKKVRKNKFKSDYEPYNGLGPFIGVFHIHEAEKVVELADAYGIDAIELGYIIGFILEAVSRGLLKPEDVGISGVPEFEPSSLSEKSSMVNSKLAIELVEHLAFGTNPIVRLIGERGLRDAARILNILYNERCNTLGVKFSDLLVYAPFGDRGHIGPNYYWTPGLVAPLYILGKYWTFYSGIFIEPEDFAIKCFERAVYELLIENAGFCRFHRGWAEKLLPILMERFFNIEKPLDRAKNIYKLIVKYQKLAGAYPTPWDSSRIIDFMAKAAEEYGNTRWTKLFKENAEKAAMEWWNRFYNMLEKLLKE
jgi:glyceraldehyde-3-phosphate dehydrogenase (ferredoxin)